MSDTDFVSRSDVLSLATRIRELEAHIIRAPLGGERASGGTNCTDCGSNCTDCGGDRLREVLLPGEFDRLSGAELVRKLQAGKGGK